MSANSKGLDLLKEAADILREAAYLLKKGESVEKTASLEKPTVFKVDFDELRTKING